MRTLSMLVVLLASNVAIAQFQADVEPLIQSSCVHCHDATTETGLNFETLDYDLQDSKTFQAWEKIFDRVQDGDMPPASEERPNPEHVTSPLSSGWCHSACARSTLGTWDYLEEMSPS